MDFKRVSSWSKSGFKEIRRMATWLVVTLILFIIIAVLAPQQIGVTLYKLSLLTMAAWVGYWIDRALFPYARPHIFIQGQNPSWFTLTMIRRAIIVAAAMLAMGLAA